MITNFLCISSKPNDKFNSIFKQTKQYLKLKNDIIITHWDKGNVTVIMNLADYKEKANDMLLDKGNYIKLPRNTTSTIQQKTNKIVSELKPEKKLKIDEAKSIAIYNAVAPKFRQHQNT